MYRVILDVDNVDLEKDKTLEVLADAPHDLAWTIIDRGVRATLFFEGTDPAGNTIEVVHWLENVLDGARVERVNEDFVSTRDIAAELSLSRETIRTWVVGKRGPGGFPRPRGTLGGGQRGGTRFWAWSDVTDWLDRAMSIAVDYQSLSADEVADVNAHLKRVTPRPDDGGPDAEWRNTGPLNRGSGTVSMQRSEDWDDSYRTPLSFNHVCLVHHGAQLEVPTRLAGARR